MLLLGGTHPFNGVEEALVGVVEVRLGEGHRRHRVALARLHVHHAGLEALESGALVLEAVARIVGVVELRIRILVTAEEIMLGHISNSFHSILHHILE